MQNFTQGKASNPFELPHVRACGNIEALHTLPNRSNMVVLAASAMLDIGLARDLLFNYGWAADPANTIILPFGAGRRGSLAALLAKHPSAVPRKEGALEVQLELSFRVLLTAEELEARQAAAV